MLHSKAMFVITPAKELTNGNTQVATRISTIRFIAAALLWSAISNPASGAAIGNLDGWTQVQDPADPGMTGSVNGAGDAATLTATGVVPGGTDIGYQSVDGNTVADSSSGYYFSSSEDFHIAVDFSVVATGSIGFGAIGFGIGEDGGGMNSAGPALAVFSGLPISFAAAARIDDANQLPLLFSLAGTLNGRFFVQYDSATGDIISGVSATQGSANPDETQTFSQLQGSWNDADLLASFFLRSESLQGGAISATFSDFTVIEGTPLAAVPLPATAWLFGSALFGLVAVSRSRKA